MKKESNKPTDSELEILKVLWDNGPSTVRFVNEKLNEVKLVGYTTTLKFMQIMLEKGILERSEDGRNHIYKPVLKEEETQKKLLDRFMSAAFGGSAVKMVMQALGDANPSKEELQQIRKLLDNLEGGTK